MIIVREYRASPNNQSTPIVVITEFEERPELPAAIERGISFLNEDFTKIAALERAGIHRATTCIVLADTAGGRSEQDADARTILAALTVEKLNEDVYTCAELLNPSYGSHLKMGGVNDFVVSGEYGAYLLAQASMNRGLMEVYSELLTYEHGNEIYRLAIPDQWIGHSFREAMIELKDRYNAILVGVYSASGKTKLNPKSHLFVEGDEVVVIALDEFQLDPSTPGKTTPG